MKVVALVYLSALLISASANAQIDFIKYKNYLIPVGAAVDTDTCPELSTTKTNIFYVDDFGVSPQDPNGYLDLAIVLGLSKKHSNNINLVGVGVGVSGKMLGVGYQSVNPTSVSHAKSMYASAMGVGINNTAVYSGSSLTTKIDSLATCSTTNHRLVLATGGLWHDAYYPLKNSPVRDNVHVIGITGSNLSTGFHKLVSGQSPAESANTGACDAFKTVFGDASASCAGSSSISNPGSIGIGRDDFRGIIESNTINHTSAYNNCLAPFIVTALGASVEADITNSIAQQHGSVGHNLIVADYAVFALGANLDSLENLYTQSFFDNTIKEALRELPGVTASCD